MSTVKENLFRAGLVLAVFVGLNLVAKAGPLPLNTNPTGAYIINSTADIETLRRYVNDENGVASSYPAWNSAGETFILMNDISGFNKSIGTSSHPFMGTFDGNGHKITLSISSMSITSLGIFGYTNGATIKNLISTGDVVYFHNYSSGAGLGAIVGTGNNTTITHCTNLANITIAIHQLNDIGGIAGSMMNSTITSCANAGNITIMDGGVFIGGIVGAITNGAVSGCVNIGTVKAINEVGGIVGGFWGNQIIDCANAGWVSGNLYVGGIIGIVYSLTSMQNCLNTGVIQGNTHVYSLVGYRNGNYSLLNKISNCYYDNQMSPYTAIQGIANPPTVHGLSTNELTQPAIKNVLGGAWHIFPDIWGIWGPILPYEQIYSYPFIHGNNSYISDVAAMPVRLANGNYWNSVSSVIWLDKMYVIKKQTPPGQLVFGSGNIVESPENGSFYWEANGSGLTTHKLNTLSGTQATYGADIICCYNPAGYSGLTRLIASMHDANGNIYQKTVPIITNGTPFKINISDYDMYGFEASEVSPNIVTSNAVMDVSSAVEGYLTVTIFDMSGAKVMEVINKSVTAQSQTQVELNNLNNLSAGNYMVAVSVGNNVVFRRFVKQ